MSRARTLAAALACAACGTFPLKGRDRGVGKLDSAALAEVPVCGHEVAVEASGEGGARRDLGGELLAATPEGLTIATRRGIEVVPAGSVREVAVQVLPKLTGLLVPWALAGSASTASHGVILIASLPTWLFLGVGSAASPEAGGREVATGFDAALLSQYARFPQGLPPGWPPDAAAVRPCSEPGAR